MARSRPVLYFIECAGCKTQAPATNNQGVPDIPASWYALCAESRPDYELYACSEVCSQRAGYALHLNYPHDHIVERRVSEEIIP